eukprot:gene46506-63008_t
MARPDLSLAGASSIYVTPCRENMAIRHLYTDLLWPIRYDSNCAIFVAALQHKLHGSATWPPIVAETSRFRASTGPVQLNPARRGSIRNNNKGRDSRDRDAPLRLTESATAPSDAPSPAGPARAGICILKVMRAMFAIVRTGGKQYRVAAGDKIVIDKIEGEAGASITLGDVLLAGEGSELKS